MNDYETQYEEYKKSILHDRWLKKTLNEKYCESIAAEVNYIDQNNVLFKIGALGTVGGFCVALAFISLSRGLWFLGIVLLIAIIGIWILATNIAGEFKKSSGAMNFYAFIYHKHFKDHIQKDKSRLTKDLMEDLFKNLSTIRYRAKVCKSESEIDMDEVMALLKFIENMDDYQAKYDDLSKYDRFAKSIKNDYSFNLEIQKDIGKYI